MTRPAFRKEWLLYGAAAAALMFSTTSVIKSQPKIERLEPVGDIAAAPFEQAIAATGVVEPVSRTIAVAPDIEGVVKSIFVGAGDRVTAGAPLFALDERRRVAAVSEAKARVAQALAEIEFRKAEQRAAEAGADADRVTAARLSTSVERYRPIAVEAMSAEEFDKLVADAEEAKFNYRAADQTAKSAAAAADAATQLAALARAELAGAEAELARTVLRSPIDGSVLSIDVRIGEAVRPADRNPASISVGDLATLIARVEIDEAQADRFDPAAAASAFIRGRQSAPLALRFVSIEPMLKPKAAFRDASSEYVDARILEARYAIADAQAASLYVGQLLDIYIDASGERPGARVAGKPEAAEAIGASTASMLAPAEDAPAPSGDLRP